jgi:hypothetical protein
VQPSVRNCGVMKSASLPVKRGTRSSREEFPVKENLSITSPDRGFHESFHNNSLA